MVARTENNERKLMIVRLDFHDEGNGIFGAQIVEEVDLVAFSR